HRSELWPWKVFGGLTRAARIQSSQSGFRCGANQKPMHEKELIVCGRRHQLAARVPADGEQECNPNCECFCHVVTVVSREPATGPLLDLDPHLNVRSHW